MLEKRCNQLIISTWNIIKERSDYDRLGQEFWDRLNKLAPDQTHIFRRPVTPTPYTLDSKPWTADRRPDPCLLPPYSVLKAASS